jgi:hypothetical protein
MALPMSLAGGGAQPRPGRRTASCHTVKVRGRVLNRPRSIPVGVAFDGTHIWATNARLGQRVEDRAVLSDHSPRRQHRTTAKLKRPETATRQGTAPGQRSPTENTAGPSPIAGIVRSGPRWSTAQLLCAQIITRTFHTGTYAAAEVWFTPNGLRSPVYQARCSGFVAEGCALSSAREG